MVVIAVRGDFWDRCAAYPELAGALQKGPFVVGPMTESDLRRAITGPADTAGLKIDPGLTGTILGDLRAAGGGADAGVLPLLSQAMALTWENREGSRLTSHGYGQSGGISRAVQVSADSIYDSLPAGQQELARDLLCRMTVASRDGRFTRRPVTRADLETGHPGGDQGRVDAVLEAFAARRLIVLDGDRAQISHDALLSAWPRLRGWLEEDQASWILHGQLADDAAAWHDHHGDPSFLYRGTQLAALEQATARWSASPGQSPAMSTVQGDFLRTSQRAATRGVRRRRGGVAVLALLTVAAMAASGLAFQQRSHYLQQRNHAIYNEVTAEALQATATNPSLAAQLTLAAYRMQPTEGLASQLISTENIPLATPLTRLNGPFAPVALSPDGRTLASASSPVGPVTDTTIQLMDVSNPAHPRLLSQPSSTIPGVFELAFSPDGRILASALSGIQLWDVSNPARPRPLGQPLTPDASINCLAFSPHGQTLATASNSTIQLWDLNTPPIPGRSAGPVNGVDTINDLAFSPDGRTLASGEANGTGSGVTQVWDVSDPAHPRLLGHP